MYELRPAGKSDYEFLLCLNELTMKEHIIKTYGSWDEEVEERYFEEGFETADYQVIIVDGMEVGGLAVTRTEHEIFINEIQIHPRHQHRGIGRAVFESFIAESEKRALPINLEVLKVNQTAYDFYTKIGFVRTGENETHYRMGRKPEKLAGGEKGEDER